MMRISRYLTLILLFNIVLFPAHAQDSDPIEAEGWPVVERCIGEAVTPPHDWSFPGTIITTGWAGIHGLNANWDTPRVLVFTERTVPGGYGTLSPDGRWYAVPEVTAVYIDSTWDTIHVTGLTVYDLTDRGNTLHLDWEDSYEAAYGSVSGQDYTFRSPVWFDEDTFIYQRGEVFYRIHVPDLEIEEWIEPQTWQGVSPVWRYISHPSPDWSRIAVRRRRDEFLLFNTETNEYIADIDAIVAWHPDSTEFLSYDYDAQTTRLYGADGVEHDAIPFATFQDSAYAPDGTHFWLWLQDDEVGYPHLAIANGLERTIVDTCFSARYPRAFFSPDSRYLAFFPRDGFTQLQILDIENWQLYNTDIYHEGRMLGWRIDDD